MTKEKPNKNKIVYTETPKLKLKNEIENYYSGKWNSIKIKTTSVFFFNLKKKEQKNFGSRKIYIFDQKRKSQIKNNKNKNEITKYGVFNLKV